MHLEFSGVVFEWRGPAPHHFIRVPDEECEIIAGVAGRVSYGWRMIPATVTLGRASWTTSLWPKDGGYIVPLRTAERRSQKVELGDDITLQLDIAV